MLGFLKSRTFLTILGLLLIAISILYFGPFIALGDPASQYFPLGTLTRQLIAIAIVVAVWLAVVLVQRLKANRASDQLIAAVVKQPAGKEPASAEAVQLRERFEEAVATLKQKRRSGHSLYDLPWYVIIGAPGSGKTTALVNSGLNFPLEQRTGKGALRGVGGTRNCDWWFTDEAVLLDTAGRYTTQDSDAASDSAGWAEFLALLRKYRKRRPLNGVILTISAQDLLTHAQGGQESHVLATRRRLNELNKELRIQLPVYLMVTKVDLVAGFTEYFDDLAQDGRGQVWGVTFPYEQTLKGGAAEAFPQEFDALIARLNERVFARLEEERDVRRRTKIFAFPQQMAAMKDALSSFAAEVFGGTRFDQRVLLRGIYFTSGTQVGNPIDRLLGAIGRRFAIAPDAVAPAAGKGRAYFIQRLLKDVLFGESGLAGVDRRTEALKATGQLGAYVAIALAVVLVVIAWSVSYGRNVSYLAQVDEAVKKLRDPITENSSLDQIVARLDAVSEVYHVADPVRRSWLMGWGLYQGGSIGAAAKQAYARELRNSLLPMVAARFRQHLDGSAGSAAILYAYLKGYLLLVYPDKLDKERQEQVEFLAELEWRAQFPADPERRNAVSRHFNFLVSERDDMLPIQLDQPAVTRARQAIALASQPEIIYQYITIDNASNTANDIRLDNILGIGAERVFTLKNGRLSDPVRGLYTKKVFEAITSKGGIDEYVKRFRSEDWVWGDSRDSRPAVASRETSAAVLGLYERDYVRAWKAVLDNLQSVPLRDLAQTKDVLQILAGQMSPARNLLKLVDEHTYLKKTPDPAAARGGGALSGLGNLIQPLTSASAPVVEPGTYITDQFAAIHELVTKPGPLDSILARLLELQRTVQPIGPTVGGTDAASPQATASVGEAAIAVQRDAQMLPPTVGGVFTKVAGDAMAVVGGGVRNELESLYQREVVKDCTDSIEGRYPFERSSKNDVLLADFGRIFGYGGVYDQFFTNRLQNFVDLSRKPWAWRTLSSGKPVGLSTEILKRFQDAAEIREMFFPRGSKTPEVVFTVTSNQLSPNTQRFVLEVAGKKLDYRNGPETSIQFNWGSGPEGAAATLDGRGSDKQSLAFPGPWAWFRLINAGSFTRDAVEQFVLQLGTNPFWATVQVKANSVRNPLSNPTLLIRFQCN